MRERERERRDCFGSPGRLRKEKGDGSNWVGRMTEKDPDKHTKANNLTGWTGGTWLLCLLSCFLPLNKKRNKVLLHPLFSSGILLPGVPFHILCFNYVDSLIPVSLVYLLDQIHFCLSTGYFHINTPFIFWGSHCLSSPTSAIGVGKIKYLSL